jgi:hypothetical protein
MIWFLQSLTATTPFPHKVQYKNPSVVTTNGQVGSIFDNFPKLTHSWTSAASSESVCDSLDVDRSKLMPDSLPLLLSSSSQEFIAVV